MSLLDAVTAPLRALLGDVEREVEKEVPVHGIEQIQERILDTEQAIRSATESIADHVEAIETLAVSLPPLVVAVEALTAQLTEITKVLAPVAVAEQDMAKVGRFLHHRHDPPAEPAGSS